jgi:hypothetical protein
MTFSPARLARRLIDLDDKEILRIYEDDLAEVLPGFAGTVVEAEVRRWPTGSPYCFPGRAKLQSALTRRRGGRVFLGRRLPRHDLYRDSDQDWAGCRTGGAWPARGLSPMSRAARRAASAGPNGPPARRRWQGEPATAASLRA